MYSDVGTNFWGMRYLGEFQSSMGVLKPCWLSVEAVIQP